MRELEIYATDSLQPRTRTCSSVSWEAVATAKPAKMHRHVKMAGSLQKRIRNLLTGEENLQPGCTDETAVNQTPRSRQKPLQSK